MEGFGHLANAPASDGGRYSSFQGFQTAIKARLHGRDRRAGDGCDLVQLHLFLETQDQDFAVDGRDPIERKLKTSPLLLAEDLLQWRLGFLVLNVECRRVFVGPGKRFEALRFLATMPVKHQVARNSEKPSFEFPLAVVLMAAFENAQPSLLEKVFGALTVSGEVNQVAEKAELILLDEAVEQIGIAAPEGTSQRLGVIEHERGEAYRAGPGRGSGRRPYDQGREEEAHLEGYTGGRLKKTQGAVLTGIREFWGIHLLVDSSKLVQSPLRFANY